MTAVIADLFVCHASEDGAPHARRLVKDFESLGVKCWIAPRDIPPGKSWPSAIVTGIEGSRGMVLVLTDRANASNEIEKEVTLAAHLHKVIFPLRVADIPLSGTLLYQIQSKQWRDLFEDREAVLQEIADQVKFMRGGADAISPTPSPPPRPQPSTSGLLNRRTAIAGVLGASAVGLSYQFGPDILKRLSASSPATRDVGDAHIRSSALETTAPQFAAGREDRVALTIGNSNYLNVPSLPNPTRDSETVATAFKDIGFTTFSLNNLSKAQIDDALSRFEKRAANSDWAVLFYSGHAASVNGTNYIFGVDARVESASGLANEGITLETLLKSLGSTRKIKVAILDACRNNPFLERGPLSTRGLAPRLSRPEADTGRPILRTGLARVTPPASSIIAYSAAEGATALDGDGMTSPFVTAFVRRCKQPGVEIGKVFRLVADDVYTATNGAQNPAVYSTLSGEDFYFVPPSQANGR
jgi:caspase domain-containing protein/TIR domain-containing protein